MSLRSIRCTGKILNDGGLTIIDKGFCISNINEHPDMNNSTVISVNEINSSGEFNFIITGLTENTDYWINSYAINSNGVSISDISNTIKINTGKFNNPYITINVLLNDNPVSLLEMGTSSLLVISGETYKGDENIFIKGYLNQNSSPLPINPIISWDGYSYEYNTKLKTSVNFLPRHLEKSSWSMVHNIYCECGNPKYIISASSITEAVFPFLWSLESSDNINESYFNNGDYYNKCSNIINTTTPTFGKIISKNKEQIILLTPYNQNYKYLYFSYPHNYPDIQFSLDGLNWGSPSLLIKNVYAPKSSNIINYWEYKYKFLIYEFNTYSSSPIYFYTRPII